MQVDRSRKEQGASDPERCKAEALRRARTTVRRFCTEHRLLYMWTLTYRGEGEHDIRQARKHFERLVAKVVQDRNGRRFPYVVVPELHPAGHGIHLHVAVPFFYKHAKLAQAWGKGFVFCTNMKNPGDCGFVGSRRAAKYLAKYLGKAFEENAFGRHRYERAQGFAVESYRVRRWDMDDGQDYAEAVIFRAKPEYVWRSEEQEDWAGPPCRVLFFMARAPNG